MIFTLQVTRTNFFAKGKNIGKYAGFSREWFDNLTMEQVADQLNKEGYTSITAAYLSRVITSRKPRRFSPLKLQHSTVNVQLFLI